MKVRGAVPEAIGRPAPYTTSRPITIPGMELNVPGPTEVLARTEASGIWHSDLSVVNGALRPQPLDRFGLCFTVTGCADPQQRVMIMSRRLDDETNPERFVARWAEDAVALAAWHGRTETEAADIEQTVPLVLGHGNRRQPFQAIASTPQTAGASW